MRAVAVAHPNVALIKYWGKRARTGNLPATGSLSLVLGGLVTETSVDCAGTGTGSRLLDGIEDAGTPTASAPVWTSAPDRRHRRAALNPERFPGCRSLSSVRICRAVTPAPPPRADSRRNGLRKLPLGLRLGARSLAGGVVLRRTRALLLNASGGYAVSGAGNHRGRDDSCPKKSFAGVAWR